MPGALLLDLDETLIDGAGLAAGTLAACAELAVELGGEPGELAAEANATFGRLWPELEQDWILGRIDDVELTAAVWAEFLAVRDRPGHDATRLARVHLAALHASYRAFSDVLPFLDAARDAGLALAIVTNGSTIAQRAKINLLGSERFVSIVVSAEHGVAKPDAAVFRIALDELGVAPAEAIHIGDNPVKDVQGARRAGIRAILLDRAGVAPLGPDVAHDLGGVRALLGS
jgi:HAD superfamily hydrolase (TIGR01549 family)